MGKLIDSIGNVVNNLDKEAAAKACLSFWGRAAYVASNNGVFINDKRYKKYKTLVEAANESSSDMDIDM